MRFSTWTRRLTAMLGVLLIPLLALATTGAAQALPLALYADTSVAVSGFPVVDTISATPVASTSFTLPAGASFTLHETSFGPATWAPQTTVQNGLTFTLASDGVGSIGGALFPVVPGSTQFTASVSNGGGAVSKATVTVSWTSTTVGSYTVTADDVTLPLAVTNNTLGTVDLLPTVAGVAEVLTNAPSGVALAGGVISGTNAIPGTYHSLRVTASDAAGATAVETLSVLVKGGVVHAVVPVLSHGHAVCIAPTREDVYYEQSGAASWDHFTIVGPGGINGHEGWVYGNLGLNVGVYAGLLGGIKGHGYTVYYTPVESQGSDVQIPGTHTGYVFFVTNTNC
jgi:hypothetical protein